MMHLVHRGKDAALKALLAKQMGLYILITDSSPRSSVLLMHIRVTAVPLIVPFHHLPVLFAVPSVCKARAFFILHIFCPRIVPSEPFLLFVFRSNRNIYFPKRNHLLVLLAHVLVVL